MKEQGLWIVRSKHSNDVYEADYLLHGITGDVFSGHRLSHYDGMPIGPRVWIHVSEVEVHHGKSVQTLRRGGTGD